MTKSLFETNLDDVQAVVELPIGKYVGTIVSTKHQSMDDEKEKISIGFKVLQPVSEVDLTGVNLNRYVYKTIILTEKSFPYVKKELIEAGVATEGESLKGAIASLEGQEVEFQVVEDSWEKKNERPYKPSVGRFKVAS